MLRERRHPRRLAVLCIAIWAAALSTQTATATANTGQPVVAEQPRLCDQPVPTPPRLPPPGAEPVVYVLGLCFGAQGDVSLIEPATYLSYVHLRPSRPSQGEWVTFDDATRRTILDDFKRLWATEFLDDLRIEVNDYEFANGVIGKIVAYHIEERPRLKVVSYDGSKQLDLSKLEEQLKKDHLDLRIDSFLSVTTIPRVKAAIRQQMAERGYINASVTHTTTEVAGSAKLVHLTFIVADGPRLMIRDVEFVGNRAVPDSSLEPLMKENRAQGLLSPLSGRGIFKADKFADDAQRVEDYYRDHGYAIARVGQPEVRPLDVSTDGTVEWIQLRIPVEEGARFKLGRFEIDGNTVLATDTLRSLFRLETGDVYRQQTVREGLERAREIYGAGGYMEFTGYPDLSPDEGTSDVVNAAVPVALAAVTGDEPVVNVVLRLTEGQRYLVNRISFVGNVTTRDNVIRRELQLLEGGVFNTDALKQSVRRINQLGYFKAMDGSDNDVKVQKATTRPNAVDVQLTVQEQNRNQLAFGAGVSQYDGVFGNLSFTTANLLGRGESVTLSGQRGSRAANYQLAFTEPFLFDRPISLGFNLFSSKVDYLSSENVVGFSQVREGASLTTGRRLFTFSRLFLGYSYEVINTAVGPGASTSLAATAAGSPLYNFGDRGRNTESRVTPSYEFNTVDNPIRPRSGVKIVASLPIAGGALGGTSDYVRPELETVVYIPTTKRTALGLRSSVAAIQPFGDTSSLPYYLRLFMGGEYQIRGVNIRTIGPTDSQGRAIGGTRSLLFNAEYYVDMFGPVRLVLYHDAGQAFSERQAFDLTRLRTSSGMEVRFMMPVLNVPFRLIYARNIYRDVFQPAQAFKFAVGTTF